MMHFSGLFWNMMLAVIPVLLGNGAAKMGALPGARRNPAIWLGVLALLCLWLAMLPNTCYLLTEWRHFLDRVDNEHLYQQSVHNQRLLLDLSLLALFYFFYSGFGALTLTLAIRPVEHLGRTMRLPFPLVAPLLFLVLSLGVYLGLVVRLNSWDLLTRPHIVWAVIRDVHHHPLLMAAIAVFASLLWALYEALDLWVEALEGRLARLRPNR